MAWACCLQYRAMVCAHALAAADARDTLLALEMHRKTALAASRDSNPRQRRHLIGRGARDVAQAACEHASGLIGSRLRVETNLHPGVVAGNVLTSVGDQEHVGAPQKEIAVLSERLPAPRGHVSRHKILDLGLRESIARRQRDSGVSLVGISC